MRRHPLDLIGLTAGLLLLIPARPPRLCTAAYL